VTPAVFLGEKFRQNAKNKFKKSKFLKQFAKFRTKECFEKKLATIEL
jgi:hypothetical protein